MSRNESYTKQLTQDYDKIKADPEYFTKHLSDLQEPLIMTF